MIEFLVYLVFIAIMSIITIVMYATDKKRAIKNEWRIKESVLLGLSLFGGSIGGLFSLYKLRHKNRHWYFVAINFLALLLQIVLGVAIYIYFN